MLRAKIRTLRGVSRVCKTGKSMQILADPRYGPLVLGQQVRLDAGFAWRVGDHSDYERGPTVSVTLSDADNKGQRKVVGVGDTWLWFDHKRGGALKLKDTIEKRGKHWFRVNDFPDGLPACAKV